MWWHKAQPGDKVVCVSDEWTEAPGNNPNARRPEWMPAKGEIYTLERIVLGPDGYAYLKPVELHGAFNVRKFRPVEPASDKSHRAVHAILDQYREEPVLEEA